jgi:hypothetical protein
MVAEAQPYRMEGKIAAGATVVSEEASLVRACWMCSLQQHRNYVWIVEWRLEYFFSTPCIC